jgi:hypothetical protein
MSNTEIKVLGIPLPQDYEKNERRTRKGGFIEQMLSFATLCSTFGYQAEMYQHFRLENVYVSAGLALLDSAAEMKSLIDVMGSDFFSTMEGLIDDMQARADWFLMHGGIDLDPRQED